MGRAVWEAAPDDAGALVSDVLPGLRLTVTKAAAPATVRFVVEERTPDGSRGHPVLSGTRGSVAAAIAAAEEGAARIVGG